MEGERGKEVEAVEAGDTLLDLTFAAGDSQGPQSCARRRGRMVMRTSLVKRVERGTQMNGDRNMFRTGRKVKQRKIYQCMQ